MFLGVDIDKENVEPPKVAEEVKTHVKKISIPELPPKPAESATEDRANEYKYKNSITALLSGLQEEKTDEPPPPPQNETPAEELPQLPLHMGKFLTMIAEEIIKVTQNQQNSKNTLGLIN